MIQSQHVTVEINTVFQQLVTCWTRSTRRSSTRRSARSRRRSTAAARSSARRWSTSTRCWPRSSRACRTCRMTSRRPCRRSTPTPMRRRISSRRSRTRRQLSNSIVDQQQNLDEFLVSAIGLADLGNEVVGANRQGLTDVAAPARAHHRSRSPSTTTRCGAASAASSRSRSLRRSTSAIIVTCRPDTRRRALPLSRRPAEGRRQERWRQLLRGAGPARPARRTSCRRSSPVMSAPTRRSTETRASC